MRVKTFYRALRLWAIVVLCFFVWTFGPLWQAVAYAATSQNPDAGARTPNGSLSGTTGALEQRPEERFERALEHIREKVGKAEARHAKGEDDAAEIEAIRSTRNEINQLDGELRKDFAVTEKRLKAAGLPNVIQDRHAAFVEHYEDNLKELKTNINAVEKAKTRAERQAKLAKARLHLEKTKAPTRHQKLDPNKLSHRQVRGKEKSPRLRKEDFERDFPLQNSSNSRDLTARHLQPEQQVNRKQYKPIILASNELYSDIPFTLGLDTVNTQVASSDLSPLFLALLTADLPTPDDIAEAPPAILFTTDIRELAVNTTWLPAGKNF